MLDFAHHSEGLPNQCPYCGFAIRFPPLGGIGCVACSRCNGVSWFGENGIVEPLPKSIAEEFLQLQLQIDANYNTVDSIPESVARENSILPLAKTPEGFIVAAVPPVDFILFEKLQFILNLRFWVVPVTHEWFVAHIKQLYG